MISVSVQIDHQADIPVRSQISSAYAQAIRQGRLPPGAQLPSVRALSVRLSVSPATVVAAYRELCSCGLAVAFPRSAFRVAGNTGFLEPDRKEFRLNRIEPDLRIHPVAEFATLLAELAASDPALGGYEEYCGYAGLREAIAGLDSEIGIKSDPENGMLIASGAQQGLCLLARSFDKGTAIALEDPCYPGARLAFGSAGVRLIPVHMTDDGPDSESLARMAQPGKIAAFYCCPTYGNPTGFSWSEAARIRVMEAARSGGFMLIEDDYLGDLDYLGEAQPRLAALASRFPDVQVIRIRSFSKCLLPALRLASLTAPPALINHLLSFKAVDDLGSSAFLQRTLARFIRTGKYHQHLERVRPHYRSVREALRSALSELTHPVSFDDPPAGMCLMGRIGADVDLNRFVAECAKGNVLISPGSDYWLDAADGARKFRVGFGALAPNEVPLVVSAFARAAASAGKFSGDHSIL